MISMSLKLTNSDTNPISPSPSNEILVIDDDEGIREALQLTLEMEGYTVFTAANGKVGLEFLSSQMPRLILLDLMMPVMNGWAFLEAVEKDPVLATIPIVVMTAFRESEESVKRRT